MNKQGIYSAIVTFSLATIHASAYAALIPQSGGDIIFDDDLGIYWLADTRLAASETFGVANINASGSMNWFEANTWVNAMNAFNGGQGWLGFNDWRLPTTAVPDLSCTPSAPTQPPATGTGCTGSEMGHLYYTEFGLGAGSNASAAAIAAGFTNLATGGFYWSSTLNGSSAYDFSFGSGSQAVLSRGFDNFVVPVRTGIIPVPAAFWLFGSGLIGLIGIARRRKP